MELSAELGELGDSCLHRECLDSYAGRDELLLAWGQHWIAQAERVGVDASVNQHGVIIFNKRRFTFVALDSFIEIEDQMEVFNQLQAFFVSCNGREPLSTVTMWNTYEYVPGVEGARLVVTANAASSTALRVTQDNAVLDYEFTAERWGAFVRGWSDLALR